MSRKREKTKADRAVPADGGVAVASDAGNAATPVVETGARKDPPDMPAAPEATASALDATFERGADEGDVCASVPGEPAAPGSAPSPCGEVAAGVEGELDETPPVDSRARIESIIESLLFAADRPLTAAELKRLVGERDVKVVDAAIEAIRGRHESTGVWLVNVAGGWQLRTNPHNAAWVTKLLAGRPARLSRAMMETVAIVAYRQPITRPEIDDIRGVDCGPVLKTLLDRGLVRIIGKREEVGRPLLYGTAPEFLRVFSLKDLTALPTLREFHELSEVEMASVDAQAPPPVAKGATRATGEAAAVDAVIAPAPPAVEDQEENDALLDEIERATQAAARASAPLETKPPTGPDQPPPADG